MNQISQLGRSTQGVRIINIDEGGSVASIARIVEPDEAETALEGESPAPVEAAEEVATESEES